MSKLEIIKQNYVLDFNQNGDKVDELEQSEKDKIDKLEVKQLFKQLERALDGVAECVLDTDVLDNEYKVVISNSNFIDFDEFNKIYLTTNYTCFDNFNTKQFEKGTVSKKLGLYCLSKGNYDYLKTTYVLKDDSKISVSSKYLEYLKSYNIDKNEQVLFRDDIIADLNQKILQDKEKYENDLNKVFLDVNFQKLGVADALFAFRDDDDGSGWLELSVVK